MKQHTIIASLCLPLCGLFAQTDPSAQPPPEEMARAAGVTLPKQPWHVVNIWWDFEKPVEHFTSLEMDVTIDRDVPSTCNLYVSPCGIAKINDLQFYGGLQTNINGWASKENHERIFPGKGAIFSRWSSDKKTPIGLEHVRTAGPDCVVESAGYEGEFASVRRPFAWTKGTYTYSITKGAAEQVAGRSCTWFDCRVKNPDGGVREVGSLRFEGTDFTFWAKHSAFVEVYSTAKIPHSGIPKVNVTFGWPRLNGQKVALKKASAYYPHDTGPAAPDCAWVRGDGENCVAEVGPIFKRDEMKRRHDLTIKLNTSSAEGRAFVIETDVSAAPGCQSFADKSKTLCEEWYPKINEILFSKDRPLPTAKVRLIFEPMKGVAHTSNAVIHVSEEWVTKKKPDDYGMVIHELTHVVQDYQNKVKGEDGWLTEGIADFIRHKYFEKNIKKLRINPDKSSYKQGYTTAAAFLSWLEATKDPQLVHKLNAALHDGTYTATLFMDFCGAPLDDLWKAFVNTQRSSTG